MGVCPGISTLRNSKGWRQLACRLLLATLVCLPVRTEAELLINEFLPDPAGSDGGREFVELINTGEQAVSLELVALEFANGAVAPDWVTRWRGTGLGMLGAGQRFLLVDRNWMGPVPGDDEVYLGLQNGPDAIRLVREDLVLDLVGYGSLTDATMFEGQPVAMASGWSLSRRPDGHDTQNNHEDFVAAVATPGAANFQAYSLLLVDRVLDPPVLARPGEVLRVSVTLRNDGTEDLPAGPCRLLWPGGEVGSWWDGAQPDEERTLVFVARPGSRGVVPLNWEYILPAGGDTLRHEIGAVQVGAGSLRLNEVMAAPDQGQGEWIELQWTGAGARNLAGYAVRDEDGAWAALPPLTVLTNDFVVVAEDSVGLGLWLLGNLGAGGADCTGVGVMPGRRLLGSWPALNNSPPESRLFADRVYLADPQGVVIDAVTYGGLADDTPERGLSLERLAAEPVNPGAANWITSTALAGSTPGCVNSVTVVEGGQERAGVLGVAPMVLDRLRGISAVHLQFVLVGDEVSWEVRLFNLWGDQVRDFGGDARGRGPRDLVWDGTGDHGERLPPGAYLVWLEIRSSGGLVARREKVRLVVR